jgi:hypothetical protein
LFAAARQLALGAAALVMTLGQETASWHGAGRLIVSVLLVTALGEVAQRIVLRTRWYASGHGRLP